MQWLSGEFLHYLSEWEKSVEAREDVDDAEKAVMLLSAQTSYGLKTTGISSYTMLFCNPLTKMMPLQIHACVPTAL